MKIEIPSLTKGKKIYFASDFHLGSPNRNASLEREKKITRWLDSIKDDAQALILVGDLFDFWFEYKYVAPKGFVRFLNKLAEFSESGIKIYIFMGNHDLWFGDYLPQETGAEILDGPVTFRIENASIYVAHGDGLGKGQNKFKLVKWFFTNPICQWLFGWLHPDIGFKMANIWSQSSKKRKNDPDVFHNALVEYSEVIDLKTHHQYYVYGDCHDTAFVSMKRSAYVNLGEWIAKCSYGVYDGNEFELMTFDG